MRFDLSAVIARCNVLFFEPLISVWGSLDILQRLLEARGNCIKGLLGRRIAFCIGDIGAVWIDVEADRASASQCCFENHGSTTAEWVEDDACRLRVPLDCPFDKGRVELRGKAYQIVHRQGLALLVVEEDVGGIPLRDRG